MHTAEQPPRTIYDAIRNAIDDAREERERLERAQSRQILEEGDTAPREKIEAPLPR